MSSSIFASPDIATLVAHFSPVSITDGRPTLVRSRSGNHLVNLTHAAARLTGILEASDTRIGKDKVNTFLDVDDGVEKWLYEEISVPLRESKNGRDLIPAPVARSITSDLFKKARTSIVDLDDYSTESDISLKSLQDLVNRASDDNLCQVSKNGSTFYCSDEFSENLITRLRHAFDVAGAHICDLSEVISEKVPQVVLHKLASDIVKEVGGEVRLEGDRTVYVPANHSAAMEDRLDKMRSACIEESLLKLDDQGFCFIEHDENLAQNEQHDKTISSLVLEKWRELHESESAPEILLTSRVPRQVVVILPDTLSHGLHDLREKVNMHAEQLFRRGERTKLKLLTQNIAKHGSSSFGLDGLSALLYSGERMTDVSASLNKYVEQLEREETDHFIQLVDARLLIPLHLYASGLGTVVDPTLKEHLDEFVTNHFRREVIPQVIKAAYDQSLLQDKDKERQMEKLKQGSMEAKALSSLQAAVSKFTKKMKVDIPSPELVSRAKYTTLEASAKAVYRMSRGSDILQNLIWILLAHRSPGLYISSGKDTSRMIKQYESVGDSDVAKSLLSWRDKLKARQAAEQELQAMKDMVRSVIEQERTLALKFSNMSRYGHHTI